MTYSEKLKDPRWQKLRLEVMQRANFTCEKCWDTETTLHVHHAYYVTGRNPWEYPADTLSCLCKNCHKSEGDFSGDFEEWELAAGLQLRCERESNGDAPSLRLAVELSANPSAYPVAEAILLLHRLAIRHEKWGGLCESLRYLEVKGMM